MSDQINDLMVTAPKAIVHLRAQLARKRLGLIFGSGASHNLSFPNWKRLVSRIADHRFVAGKGIIRKLESRPSVKGKKKRPEPPVKSLASITQILFDRFRARWIKRKSIKRPLTFLEERKIRSEWLQIIHECLYRNINHERRQQQIERHPYLMAFKDIIKNSPLTINFNFDDSLEKMLLYSRSTEELSKTRGYEATDKPNAQFQKESGIIYHPNGFLPSTFQDGSSADVVFSDDAFQDRLISAAAGKYVHLSNYLLRNTCLLIGLSLDDTILQSLLRQNAVTNPGHIHYFVHFTPTDGALTTEDRNEIFESNFSGYNLYTLFLTNNGIQSLADCLSKTHADFEQACPKAVRKFVYYVVGSVGAGKSTAAGNFRSLITYDEWIDERKAELSKPDHELTPPQRRAVDAWIREQFKKKNYAVTHANEGIHLIDRSPLDPLAFGKSTSRRKKAAQLLRHVTAGRAWPIEKGHVIFLESTASDVQMRTSLKHKYWEISDLEYHLESLDQIYGPLNRSVVSTSGRGAAEVAREIARVIFLDKYCPVDVEEELEKRATR